MTCGLINFTIFQHTECVAGYFGSGTNCTLCTGNTIKPDKGDAEECPDECDASSTQPNDGHTDCGKYTGYHLQRVRVLLLALFHSEPFIFSKLTFFEVNTNPNSCFICIMYYTKRLKSRTKESIVHCAGANGCEHIGLFAF